MEILDQLRKGLVAVLLDRLDESLIRSQCSQGSAHVGIHDLQAVDVARIDPAEPRLISQHMLRSCFL